MSRTEQTSVVRKSHATAQNSRLCVSRDLGYLMSRTEQTSVVRNSHTTAQNSRFCVSKDEGYFIPRTEQTLVTRNSHTTAQISRSRGQEYPTPARVEKAPIAQEAQTRTTVHPCSTADTPSKQKTRNRSTCTDQTRQRGREGKDR